MLFVVGTISQKIAPILRRVYDQMCEPKWVVAFGVCTCTGGFYDNYSTVQGIDTILPVDVLSENTNETFRRANRSCMNMKISYQGIEFEIDLISTIVSTSKYIGSCWQKSILGKLKGSITLISSNLYSLPFGLTINTQSGTLYSISLLKPNADGTATANKSGFLVTGLYDTLGQVEIGSALGSLRKDFKISFDMDSAINKHSNLICFGSPSSNAVSKEIFEKLESVLHSSFKWDETYSTFAHEDIICRSGDQGVILSYSSPFNSDRRTIVLAGLGPMGTLGCCKLLAGWEAFTVSNKQRKAKNFLASLEYDLTDETKKEPRILRFSFL